MHNLITFSIVFTNKNGGGGRFNPPPHQNQEFLTLKMEALSPRVSNFCDIFISEKKLPLNVIVFDDFLKINYST